MSAVMLAQAEILLEEASSKSELDHSLSPQQALVQETNGR
jgi:hypothetical protein